MTLLDRFRTQSRDKHADPNVRLAFVETIPLDDHVTITAVAREDDDARVRKAAVAKLMDPAALKAIAADDKDESVRAQAGTMLRDIALEVFEEVGEHESRAAVEAIAEPRVLAQIAKGSSREEVAVSALDRVTDARLLGSVARHAVLESIRARAFAALRERHEPIEVLAVALNSDFKDTALAAIETITSRSELELVVARGRNKSAVKRARSMMREADERVAKEAADQQMLDALAADAIVLEPETESMTPPHGDPVADAASPAAETTHEEQEHRAQKEEAERVRLAAQADALEAAAREVRRRQARLEELADEAAAAASDTDFASARRRFGIIRREWRSLTTGIDVDPAVLARYTELDSQLTAREAEAREAEAKVRTDALAKLHQLLARIEPLPAQGEITIKALERALKDVKSASTSIPPLPTKQDFDDVSRRLKAVQSALTPKLQELREAEDWKRFGNVTIQEQLCARMEALKTEEDPEAIARQVRELQEKWKASAEVPRAQADTLWRRFKTAHDEVWARCEAHFAAQAQARNENLEKKLALCDQAEKLADSTNWIQTADAIKALQAEWKTIGPVSRGREKAVWDRFRAACDRFFTRRNEDLAGRKQTWAENLAKKDALCARAEVLAESSDWDQAAAELKRLQTEWKTIGPVKKSKSEAIWQRFRAACDKFFQRYGQRHETARAERVAAREAICAELETLAAAEEAPADLPATFRTLRGRWQQEIAARGVDPDRARALDQRFTAASAAVLEKWGSKLAGTEFDSGANKKRMETLVKRMEELAGSLGASKAVDQSLSPTTRLAAMLKEALAANTIGGRVEEESRLRAAAEEARQAQSAWSRIGVVGDADRRALSDRFHRAVKTITDRAGQSARPSGPGQQRPAGAGRR